MSALRVVRGQRSRKGGVEVLGISLKIQYINFTNGLAIGNEENKLYKEDSQLLGMVAREKSRI